MSENVTLITGTSTGIGLEIAIQAAAAGHTVVATMRNLDKAAALRDATDAAGVTVDIRQLDVTDQQSIDACIASVIADHGRLDALINNAGVGHVGTIEQESVDDVRAVMEVNFFGVVMMTRSAMAALRASGGRLITITSVGGVVGQPFNEAYCAAKFAVEGFMEGLAPVAATVGVRVSVVEPGAVGSEFVSNVGIESSPLRANPGPYSDALAAYLERTAGAFANAQSPKDAAAPIVELLGAGSPAFRIQTSPGATAFAGVKLADLDGSRVIGMTTPWVS
jgi:NAD(P)-dependent dehydrogenase (short-subunit alcohol dehydrogenase family)